MFAKQLSIGLMLALPLAAIGCGRDDGPPAPTPPRSEVSSGPVELTVQFDPAAPSLADQGVLTVTVSREPGVVVERPEFGPRFGDFRLIDEREEIPAIEKDREITRYVYTLEPIRPGRAALWPVDVAFTDARPGGDGKRQILSSEPLAVEVAT
ncbi:MAG: hypothetical protein GX621_17800, partial [Pirellulaceae bacterium]|nr:hypothetical protein [Pirellulaceae bacterium]